MHEEKKLKDIVGPNTLNNQAKKITVNNVDLLEMGNKSHRSSSGIRQNEVPFINNSEKEDNAIFSHQLK